MVGSAGVLGVGDFGRVCFFFSLRRLIKYIKSHTLVYDGDSNVC